MFVYMFILAAYALLVFMYGGDSGDGNISTSTTEEASSIPESLVPTYVITCVQYNWNQVLVRFQYWCVLLNTSWMMWW